MLNTARKSLSTVITYMIVLWTLIMMCDGNSVYNAINITYHPSEWEISWRKTAHELVQSNESIHKWTKGCGKVRKKYLQ